MKLSQTYSALLIGLLVVTISSSIAFAQTTNSGDRSAHCDPSTNFGPNTQDCTCYYAGDGKRYDCAFPPSSGENWAGYCNLCLQGYNCFNKDGSPIMVIIPGTRIARQACVKGANIPTEPGQNPEPLPRTMQQCSKVCLDVSQTSPAMTF